MTDRFDEMAGRVQMDLAAFAMPTGTSARRVIADALRAAHAGGVDEAAATIDQLRADIEKLRDDRADLQERCNRLMAERNAAVHMVASADSEWKVRAEKAEREFAAIDRAWTQRAGDLRERGRIDTLRGIVLAANMTRTLRNLGSSLTTMFSWIEVRALRALSELGEEDAQRIVIEREEYEHG